MAIITTGSQLPNQGSNSQLSIQQDGNAQWVFKSGTGSTATTALTLSATQLTAAGSINFPAGTTSAAPLNFQTGTLETSPVGGEFEFVSGQFYTTPSATTVARCVMPTAYFYTGTNTINSLLTSASQSIFGKSLSVDAGAYMFECGLNLTIVSASTANLNFVLVGPTGLVNHGRIKFITDSNSNFTTAVAAGSAMSSLGGVMSASTVSTRYNLVSITGTFSCTAAGTLQIKTTALTNTITSVTVNAGSYFYCYPIQNNIGGWV